MSKILSIIFIALTTATALAQPFDVRSGVIELPPGFIVESRPEIDTFCPSFTRINDNFTIKSDIGKMAGWKAHPLKKDEYDSIREITINGAMACIATKTIGGKKYFYATIAETFLTDLKGLPDEEYRKARDRAHPVNFYAEIRSDQDLIDFMLLVCSYKSKSAK